MTLSFSAEFKCIGIGGFGAVFDVRPEAAAYEDGRITEAIPPKAVLAMKQVYLDRELAEKVWKREVELLFDYRYRILADRDARATICVPVDGFKYSVDPSMKTLLRIVMFRSRECWRLQQFAGGARREAPQQGIGDSALLLQHTQLICAPVLLLSNLTCAAVATPFKYTHRAAPGKSLPPHEEPHAESDFEFSVRDMALLTRTCCCHWYPSAAAVLAAALTSITRLPHAECFSALVCWCGFIGFSLLPQTCCPSVAFAFSRDCRRAPT